MPEKKEEKLSEKIITQKKCFIITPIGNEATDTRRHIDGIIDACIIPTLGEEYDVKVAHRISDPGSINNQILSLIYSAELVIANLTNLNPNVMYELAFRHATKKPVIIIMENSSERLPFDLTMERTIFYTNDFKGVIDFKEALKNMVSSIKEIKDNNIDNPIYTALEKIHIKENIIKNVDKGDTDISIFKYIIERLDNIENKITMRDITNKNERLHLKPLSNCELINETNNMEKIVSMYRQGMLNKNDYLIDSQNSYERLCKLLQNNREMISVKDRARIENFLRKSDKKLSDDDDIIDF